MIFQIFDDTILSTYQIFLKKGKLDISNEELLKLLGIDFFQSQVDKEAILKFDYMSSRICITEVENWICIIDDLTSLINHHFFLLSDMNRDIIKELSGVFDEVFMSFNSSEASDAYDITYYKNGILERDVKIETVFVDESPLIGYGQPLKGEPKILHYGKRSETTISIIKNLGIDINFDISDGDFYTFDTK